jgi:hypothetical protein
MFRRFNSNQICLSRRVAHQGSDDTVAGMLFILASGSKVMLYLRDTLGVRFYDIDHVYKKSSFSPNVLLRCITQMLTVLQCARIIIFLALGFIVRERLVIVQSSEGSIQQKVYLSTLCLF